MTEVLPLKSWFLPTQPGVPVVGSFPFHVCASQHWVAKVKAGLLMPPLCCFFFNPF